MPASKFNAVVGTTSARDRFQNSPEDGATSPNQVGAFIPLDLMQNAIRYWWVLFLFIVAGGLFGLFFSQFRSPVYETIARFSAGIDYTSTGPLTQFEEDTAYEAVGAFLVSKTVMQTVVDAANKEGIEIGVEELKKMKFAERKFDVWELRIRSGDPAKARRIAEIWNDMGNRMLLNRYQHALQADMLNTYIRSLVSCLGRTASGEPTTGLCSHYRFEEIQSDIVETGKALAKERAASGGLFAGMIIGPVETVIVSDRPVQYDRNQLVLAGSLIGFLLGVVVLEMGVPARLFKKMA